MTEADSEITAENPDVTEADSEITAEADDQPPAENSGKALLQSEIVGPGGVNPNQISAGQRPQADDAQPAYEVSYNLSGSGYWITVGSDASRAETDEQYVLFDEEGNYDIQLRETDDFQDGYRVEVRYRMRAGENWSVPETVTFPAPNAGVKIAGHTLFAQSKWLTNIGYSFDGGKNWINLQADDYDEEGNHAMNFPDDERFPLTVRFHYQTKRYAGDPYSDWRSVYVTTPDKGPHDPEYQDMNDAYTILGRAFSLNGATVGLVQYRYSEDAEWVNIGPGQNVTAQDGSVLEEREFDSNGNYTLDMGNRKDFPIDVYFRALATDGWKYLSGANAQSESVKHYSNVFDTATIETSVSASTDEDSAPEIKRHVFSIHTTWMNDVRYAFFDESAFNQAKNDYALADDDLSWTTVSNDPDAYRRFQADGSYTIYVSSNRENPQEYPFYLIFKSISPTGTWDAVSDWTTAERRMSHLRNFTNVDSTADYEGHTFRLTTANLGDIALTVRNSQGIVTHDWMMAQDSSRLQENGGDNNYQVFDADNAYTIELTTEDTFPLVVTFNALDRNGWSDDIIWEIPFRGWEQSQKVIRVLGADYTFRLSIDFLGDTRYRWSDNEYASWTYVVPNAQPRRYSDQTVYDENGGYVIPVQNPEASDLFVADGNAYKLNRPLTIQYWNAESGMRKAAGLRRRVRLSA